MSRRHTVTLFISNIPMFFKNNLMFVRNHPYVF